jgi:hypothetical protein
MEGEGIGVYAEAKGEYTRQLCQYLTPSLHTYFLEMFDLAKEREADPKKHLLSFQTLLEGVSEWNVDKVQRETQNIAIKSQCDYLEELLTAVFIAHTKVLSAIRLTNKQKKLQITIPKLEHFLHRTLTECARHLWTNTYLFSTGSSLERQKNMKQIESLISEGIQQGIRTMLPVKSILREYLGTDESETEAEEEEEEEEEEEAEAKPEPEAEAKPEAKPEPELESILKTSRPSTPKPEPEPESILKTSRPSTPKPEPEPEPESILKTSRPSTPKPEPESILKTSRPPTPKLTPIQAAEPSPAIPTLILDEEAPRVAFSKENTVFSEPEEFEFIDTDDIGFQDEEEPPRQKSPDPMEIEFEEII